MVLGSEKKTQKPAVKRDTTSENASKPRYYLRGLDGLRALAALAVLVYHVAPNWMPGGFMGVDVFFVLSGFLITAMLTQERSLTGKIRVRSFWVRRLRRLFPAVTLTVLITVPIAALVNRDYLVGIARQVLGSLTFTYNWLNVIFAQSYFDRANPQFLSNMWTLAVEQQFYLVWPLVLLGAFLLPNRHRWVVPVLLAAASVAEMAILQALGGNLTRIYEGTDTHAFGLMLGAMLALLFPSALENTPHYLDNATVRIRGLAAWLGTIGVIASFLTLHDTDNFTYPWGVFAVSFLTVGIIQTCMEEISGVSGPGQVLVEFLSWRPLVWLGVRSYSLYLWHWPVYLIVMGIAPDLPQWQALTVITVVAILAAHLSYTFVEQPMRRQGILVTLRAWRPVRLKKWQPVQQLLAAVAVLALAVAPLGAALVVAPAKTSAAILVEKGQDFMKKHPALPAKTPGKAGDKAQQPADKSPADTTSNPGHPTPGEKASRMPAPHETEVKNTPSPTPTPIDGSQVDVIGDSVTLASVPKLAAKLPGINVNAEVSRSSIAGFSIMRAMRDQGTLRPYLVFALATNSTFRVQDGQNLLSELPPTTKIVFVTGFGKPSQQWIQISNQTMYSLAGEYPDRVKVAPWDRAIAPHPELLASDSVHPQPAGQDIYTQLIYDALQQFAH